MGKKAAAKAVSPDDGKAEGGAKLFKAKCATCHTANDGGPNKQGPNLFGVMGRTAGQVRKCSANVVSSNDCMDMHSRAHAKHR